MTFDDQRLAWQLRQDGLSWTQIAIELDCHPTVAEAAAGDYEDHTDKDALSGQYALFD